MAATATAACPPVVRPSVLVAEDNAVSREIIAHQLRMLGCDPLCANDGDEALLAWRGGRFSMLLTDLQMPGLDGYALAATVRGEETGGRTPIVALSAGIHAGEGELCRAAGMDDCVKKPISLAALRTVLERWLPLEPARAGA